jgi:hypothetical protein
MHVDSELGWGMWNGQRKWPFRFIDIVKLTTAECVSGSRRLVVEAVMVFINQELGNGNKELEFS